MLQPISSDRQTWEVTRPASERPAIAHCHWLALRPRLHLQRRRVAPGGYWDTWKQRRFYARLYAKRLALADHTAVYRARDLYNLVDFGGLTYSAALKGIKQIPPLFAREFAEFRVDELDHTCPTGVLALVVSVVDQIHKIAPKRALVLDSRSEWPESLIESANGRLRISA